MREGRRRPSLNLMATGLSYSEAAAMREGRRRPSLLTTAEHAHRAADAAMREGRRRPSLERVRGGVLAARRRRNEGGAPAPLVDPPRLRAGGLRGAPQ